MAQNPAPPRPGGGPPRPNPDGARARPAARPRPKMGGSSWSPGDDAAKPSTALEKPEFVKNPAPARNANEHLPMVPLSGDQASTYDDGKKDSSTQFFAIPGASRNRSDAPAPAPQPAGPPRAAPVAPIAGPVPAGPMVMGPQPVGGIAGPVAAGLGAAPGMGMPNGAFGTQAIQEDRSSSSRVLVLVVMLVGVVCMALVTAMGLMIFAIVQSQKEEPLDIASTQPASVTVVRPPVETGLNVGPKNPKPTPDPAPRPRPRPSPGGDPKPSPSPRPAPAPAPPAGPAAGTLTIVKPDSEFFSSVEVRCGPGFRVRGDFVGNTASVPNVPAESCVVTFKGGAAAPKLNISGARKYTCSGTGGSMICR